MNSKNNFRDGEEGFFDLTESLAKPNPVTASRPDCHVVGGREHLQAALDAILVHQTTEDDSITDVA